MLSKLKVSSGTLKNIGYAIVGLVMCAGIAISANIQVAASESQSAQITLTKRNTVAITSTIDAESVSTAQRELAKLVKERGSASYTIYLVIDSGGGSIDAGLAFIEYAKTVKNLETVTLFAASMASAIVEHLPGKRHIISSGTLMFHRAAGQVSGQFETGELESRLAYYKSIVRLLENVNANRMSMPLDAYKAAVVNEMWILGEDAVAKKAADSVTSVSCDAELIESTVTKTINFFMGSIQVEFSGCPLIKGGKAVSPSEQSLYAERSKEVKRQGGLEL